MKTIEIKNRLYKCGCKQWQLAKTAHISETTLSKWLRDTAQPKQRAEIIEAALKELEYVNMARKAK